MKPEIAARLKEKYAKSGKEPFIPKSVFIGIPAHDGKHDSEFSEFLLRTIDLCRLYDINVHTHTEGGGGICLARQEIVTEFMLTHADALFFIDNDVLAEPDAFMHVLCSPADIAVGIYPYKRLDMDKIIHYARSNDVDAKNKGMDYPVNALKKMRDGEGIKIEIPGFIEVDEAPTGFMRIKRKVIGRVQLDNPQLEYKNDLNRSQYAIFNNTLLEEFDERCTRLFSGEDYSFCRLARKSGFKIYADLEYEYKHVGRYVFRGHFGRALLSESKIAAAPQSLTASASEVEPK